MSRLFLILVLFTPLTLAFAARQLNGTNQAVAGSNCCMTIPAAASPNVSVSVWVYPTSSVTTTYNAFVNNQFPGFFSYGLQTDGSAHAVACITGNATYTCAVGPILSLNVWHHVGLVWDAPSTLVRLYIDGVQAATAVSAATQAGTTLPLAVGASYNAGCCQFWFAGRIAEAAIWSVALTPTEMSALAHGSAPTLVRPSQSNGLPLYVYWPMHGIGTAEANFSNSVIISGGNQTGQQFGSPPAAPHAPVGMPTGEGH